MYFYYLKRTFAVTNLEKLPGKTFFHRALKIFEHTQPRQLTLLQSCSDTTAEESFQLFWSIRLTPSNNLGENAVFASSDETQRVSSWPQPLRNRSPLPHHKLVTQHQLLLLDSTWVWTRASAMGSVSLSAA